MSLCHLTLRFETGNNNNHNKIIRTTAIEYQNVKLLPAAVTGWYIEGSQ